MNTEDQAMMDQQVGVLKLFARYLMDMGVRIQFDIAVANTLFDTGYGTTASNAVEEAHRLTQGALSDLEIIDGVGNPIPFDLEKAIAAAPSLSWLVDIANGMNLRIIPEHAIPSVTFVDDCLEEFHARMKAGIPEEG